MARVGIDMSEEDFEHLHTYVSTNVWALYPDRFVTTPKNNWVVQDPGLVTMYFTETAASAFLLKAFLHATGWKAVVAEDRSDGDFVVLTDRPDTRASDPVDHFLAVYQDHTKTLLVTHHMCGASEEESLVEKIASDMSGDLEELAERLHASGWRIEPEVSPSDSAAHPDLVSNANLGWSLRTYYAVDGDETFNEWVCTVTRVSPDISSSPGDALPR